MTLMGTFSKKQAISQPIANVRRPKPNYYNRGDLDFTSGHEDLEQRCHTYGIILSSRRGNRTIMRMVGERSF